MSRNRQLSSLPGLYRIYVAFQVLFHSIFMFFHELFILIPGVTSFLLFLRRRLHGKQPPVSYVTVPLTLLSPKPSPKDISYQPDGRGIRITSGEPVIQTIGDRAAIKEREECEHSSTVSNNVLHLTAQQDRIELTFARSETAEQWSQILIDHNLQQIYGMAEKFGPLDKRGRRWEFYNMDMIEIEPKHDPLYKSFPIAIMRGRSYWYAIIVDYPGYQRWDLQTDGNIAIELQNRAFIMDICLATSPKELMTMVVDLLGKMELPPRWALGFHQCRWSYDSAEKIREVADGFRSRNIPCDALYLDIDYMDDFKIFTWDHDNFGDLPSLITDIHQQGFKAVAMIDPGIKAEDGYQIYDEAIDNDYTVKKENGVPYRSVVWPGKVVFPDFFDPKVQPWWGRLYQQFIEVGIDGFWNDMNEPTVFNLRGTMSDQALHQINGNLVKHKHVHNLYGTEMVKNSYLGLNKLYGDKRVFLLSRSAYLGAQRYGWTWTGDNKSSWTHLQQSIPKLLNSGLSGQFASGADIGGFRAKPSPELFARWMALGLFYPLMRNHTIKFSNDQEPWVFGETITKISTNFIRLRYRLTPYIYTYFREGCETGIPLMRPMWMEYPDDNFCYLSEVENTQFMFGPSFLVAPILKKKQKSRSVYLPEGLWHHYFDRSTYTGGQFLTFSADLDEVILLVRHNSIIPEYSKVGSNMEETVKSDLKFNRFGEEGQSLIYTDDGETTSYKSGDFGLYRINKDESLTLLEGISQKTITRLNT